MSNITTLITAASAAYIADATLISLGYTVVKDHDFTASGASLDRKIWIEAARSGPGEAFGFDTPFHVFEIEIIITHPINASKTVTAARESIAAACEAVMAVTIGGGWSMEYEPAEYSGQLAIGGETIYAARITARTHQA